MAIVIHHCFLMHLDACPCIWTRTQVVLLILIQPSPKRPDRIDWLARGYHDRCVTA